MRMALLLAATAALLPAQTNLERGKKIVEQAIEALGGAKFTSMADRTEEGRAYSFYRDRLTGLSRAKIYTRYLAPAPNEVSQRERQSFGKEEEGGAVLFTEKEGWEINFRGARMMTAQNYNRWKESTPHNIFYILRQRMNEKGLIFEFKANEIFENQPVEIVDIIDSDNRTVTVFFNRSTHLPVRQEWVRRDPATKDRFEEVTRYSKYRDVGGGVMWPFAIERERNGDKVFAIYSEAVTINNNLDDKYFTLSAKTKILKPAR